MRAVGVVIVDGGQLSDAVFCVVTLLLVGMTLESFCTCKDEDSLAVQRR